MTTRKQLSRALKKRRSQEQHTRRAWRESERELAKLETALRRVEARTERLHARHIQACVTLADVRAQFNAAESAVAEAILSSDSAPLEPLSVERIAKHLGYGRSGRTRAELAKTLEQAVGKVRARLGEGV